MLRWRTSPRFPDHPVTRGGRVKGPSGKILKQRLDKYGYPTISIRSGGKVHPRSVHRLVAEAFLGSPPSPKHVVNHKSGVKTNNRVSNLEWCTQAENLKHAAQVLGTIKPPRHVGEQNSHAKLTREQVEEIRRRRKGGATQQSLADLFGVGQPQISRILLRKNWRESA